MVATCRQLSRLLGQVKPSPTLRTFAPGLLEALPLVKALVLGLEDLVDRVALIEAAIAASTESPAGPVQVLSLAETARHKRL